MMWEHVTLIELLTLTGILLFGGIQLGMALAAHFWYAKIKAWKKTLLTSRSMWARLELIIFF